MDKLIITIYIHGTLLPRAVASIPLVRNFSFCPPGLIRASELDEKFHLNLIARTLESSNKVAFNLEHFYLFGWSGKLRHTARKEAAHDLIKHLLTLKKRAEAAHKVPVFKIITHSHGGNVALYLKEHTHSNKLCIDELILLACPVQTETAEFVHDPLFKHVFSIHSHKDVLQVLDPQGVHSVLESLKTMGLALTWTHLKRLGPVFSSRHFKAGEQIVQLNVKYPHREFFHLEFLLPPFMSALPSLIAMMREHKKIKDVTSDDLTYVFTQ